MERVHSSNKDVLTGDIMSAWTAISNGVVDQNNKKREKYWKHWAQYVTKYQANPYLSNCSKVEQIIIITAFAARVRKGHYGRGHIVRVQTTTRSDTWPEIARLSFCGDVLNL